MPKIEQSVMIPSNQNAVFQVISDITRYPEFLPWCKKVEIVNQNGNQVMAKMYAEFKGQGISFITENLNIPPQSIQFQLKESGIFKQLSGIWRVESIQPDSCMIHFALDYQLKNFIMQKMLSPLLSGLISQYVQAFVDRTKKIYSGP